MAQELQRPTLISANGSTGGISAPPIESPEITLIDVNRQTKGIPDPVLLPSQDTVDGKRELGDLPTTRCQPLPEREGFATISVCVPTQTFEPKPDNVPTIKPRPVLSAIPETAPAQENGMGKPAPENLMTLVVVGFLLFIFFAG